MKKLPIYIFIIITLIGLFSPLLMVDASTENPNENCTYDNSVTTVPNNEPCKNPAFIPGTNTPVSAPTNYHLLEPLPCAEGPGCKDGKLVDFNPADESAFGKYLNFAIRLFIGLCAVLAVVMIVVGGIEYMTSELISSKEAGKERIRGAILGLLLALGAYTILFQINPDLLNTDVEIGEVELSVTITEFTLSPAQNNRDGTPGGKVDFKREACPAVLAAERATGVKAALLLAIFEQETKSGRNTGKCTPYSGSNMPASQIAALGRIINGPINNIAVSCDPGEGTGGAIGKMQFMPQSWEKFGGGGDPWSTNDSMVAAARHLIAGGVSNNEKEAACRYWAGNGRNCSYSNYAENYGSSVMGKRVSYQKIIDRGGCNP